MCGRLVKTYDFSNLYASTLSDVNHVSNFWKWVINESSPSLKLSKDLRMCVTCEELETRVWLFMLTALISYLAKKESVLCEWVLWLKSWVCIAPVSVLLQATLHSSQQLCAGSSLTLQDRTQGRSQTNKTSCRQEHAIIIVEQIDANSGIQF